MDAALIALIGLGGLFTISQQSQHNSNEGFSTIDDKEGSQVTDSINKYVDSNAATDKYYTGHKSLLDLQELDSKQVGITSLTGDKMNPNTFTHNNMVPFFGAKIRGRGGNMDQSETLLDNKIGAGSQIFKKEERAPLFKPEDNIHWAHGQPNYSNFLQSRQNPSMSMNNIKPWEEERVAPGLGDNKDAGSHGFNSGMMSRDSWMPKTVDELRVDTNPKNTFELSGHEGPAMSRVLKPGIEGEMVKNRPETYYKNTPERYLVTTGIGGSRPRNEVPVEVLKCQNRPETTAEYGGPAIAVDMPAPMVEKNYVASKNCHVYGEMLGSVSSPDHQGTGEGDYGLDGYIARPNNRVTTRSAEQFGSVGGNSGVIGSVVSPILDMIRPSRKEDTINGIRQNGNVQQGGATEATMVNPADRVKTTIRDTLEQPFSLNVEAAKRDGYLNAKQMDKTTQRESTNHFEWTGGDWSKHNIKLDDAYRNQRNNHNKLTPATHVLGNMNVFDGNYNSVNNAVDREQDNMRMFTPTNLPRTHHSAETYPKLSGGQHYDNIQNNDRIHPEILDAFKKNPYTQSLNSVF